MFYDRLQTTNVLNAYRFNGANQISYIVTNPAFLLPYFEAGTTPPLQDLTVDPQFNSRYQIDPNMRASYLMETVIGVEQQLFKHTSLTVNYMNSHGVHDF